MDSNDPDLEDVEDLLHSMLVDEGGSEAADASDTIAALRSAGLEVDGEEDEGPAWDDILDVGEPAEDAQMEAADEQVMATESAEAAQEAKTEAQTEARTEAAEVAKATEANRELEQKDPAEKGLEDEAQLSRQGEERRAVEGKEIRALEALAAAAAKMAANDEAAAAGAAEERRASEAAADAAWKKAPEEAVKAGKSGPFGWRCSGVNGAGCPHRSLIFVVGATCCPVCKASEQASTQTGRHEDVHRDVESGAFEARFQKSHSQASQGHDYSKSKSWERDSWENSDWKNWSWHQNWKWDWKTDWNDWQKDEANENQKASDDPDNSPTVTPTRSPIVAPNNGKAAEEEARKLMEETRLKAEADAQAKTAFLADTVPKSAPPAPPPKSVPTKRVEPKSAWPRIVPPREKKQHQPLTPGQPVKPGLHINTPSGPRIVPARRPFSQVAGSDSSVVQAEKAAGSWVGPITPIQRVTKPAQPANKAAKVAAEAPRHEASLSAVADRAANIEAQERIQKALASGRLLEGKKQRESQESEKQREEQRQKAMEQGRRKVAAIAEKRRQMEEAKEVSLPSLLKAASPKVKGSPPPPPGKGKGKGELHPPGKDKTLKQVPLGAPTQDEAAEDEFDKLLQFHTQEAAAADENRPEMRVEASTIDSEADERFKAPTLAPPPAPAKAPTPAPPPAPTKAPTPAPPPSPTKAPTPAPPPSPTKAPAPAPTPAPTPVTEEDDDDQSWGTWGTKDSWAQPSKKKRQKTQSHAEMPSSGETPVRIEPGMTVINDTTRRVGEVIAILSDATFRVRFSNGETAQREIIKFRKWDEAQNMQWPLFVQTPEEQQTEQRAEEASQTSAAAVQQVAQTTREQEHPAPEKTDNKKRRREERQAKLAEYHANRLKVVEEEKRKKEVEEAARQMREAEEAAAAAAAAAMEAEAARRKQAEEEELKRRYSHALEEAARQKREAGREKEAEEAAAAAAAAAAEAEAARRKRVEDEELKRLQLAVVKSNLPYVPGSQLASVQAQSNAVAAVGSASEAYNVQMQDTQTMQQIAAPSQRCQALAVYQADQSMVRCPSPACAKPVSSEYNYCPHCQHPLRGQVQQAQQLTPLHQQWQQVLHQSAAPSQAMQSLPMPTPVAGTPRPGLQRLAATPIPGLSTPAALGGMITPRPGGNEFFEVLEDDQGRKKRVGPLSADGWRSVESLGTPGLWYYICQEKGLTAMEPPHPWKKLRHPSNPDEVYWYNEVTRQSSKEKPLRV